MKNIPILESVGGAEVAKLFEHLPGYSFFAKNFKGEVMSANHAFYERLGFSAEEEIVGKTDFDLFPLGLAAKFRRDDLEVMKSGDQGQNVAEGLCGVEASRQRQRHR